MVWYILSTSWDDSLNYSNYILYDLYENEILVHVLWVITGECYPYRLESKYRYSGLLFDKLRSLLSYIYHNVKDNRDFSMNYMDRIYLYGNKMRFSTQLMYPSHIKSYPMTHSTQLYKSLYFVDN